MVLFFVPLSRWVVDSHPIVVRKSNSSTKIFAHPAALLAALVMTCYFKLAQADASASEVNHTGADAQARWPEHGTDSTDSAATAGPVRLDDRQSAMFLAAIAFATTWATWGAAAKSLWRQSLLMRG